MKLTKRMKNAIIQSTIANSIFFVLLVVVILFFCLPKVIQIEEKKTELSDVYNRYVGMIQNGVSLQELKQTAAKHSDLNSDEKVKILLRNTDDIFFDKIFGDNQGSDFATFLKQKEIEIDEIKSSQEYIEKDKALSSLLPLYQSDAQSGSGALSDFHFTNYIENIIYAFNLSASGEIGIGEIKQVGSDGEEEKGNEKQNDLDESIFMIPLSFDLAGRKSDIIDFIHFFENVGSIKVEGDSFEVVNDSFIKKSINGARYTSDYNIYKNQVADIVSISIPEYPDSSPFTHSSDIIAILKSDQSREKLELTVELNFYVAGLPAYRMELFIEEFFDSYSKLLKEVARDSKKYTTESYKYSSGEQLQAITQLQNLESLLVSQNKGVGDFKKAFSRKQDIQGLYDTIVEFSRVTSIIERDYKKQLEILTK